MKHTLTTLEAATLLYNDEFAGWSRDGAMALVEHLEQFEEDTGESIEFDPIAFRCDYSEYDSALEAAEQYTADCDTEKTALEFLEWRTTVIKFKGGIIIQNF